MADFVYNIAKGRVAEYYDRIKGNDPAGSTFVIVAVNSTTTDAILKDIDNLSLVLAEALTAEATNTGYARVVVDDTGLVALAPDDTNDRMDLDLITDPAWTAVQTAGGAWTDLIICYDAASGADTTIIPLCQFDFAVTPDGSDITAQLNAAGFFRAS